jgi:hypothetical protein
VSQDSRERKSPGAAKPIEYPVRKYHPVPFEIFLLLEVVASKTSDLGAVARRVNVDEPTGAAATSKKSSVQFETISDSRVVPRTFIRPE